MTTTMTELVCESCGRTEALTTFGPIAGLCVRCGVLDRKNVLHRLERIEKELLHDLYDADACPCAECEETRILLGREKD